MIEKKGEVKPMTGSGYEAKRRSSLRWASLAAPLMIQCYGDPFAGRLGFVRVAPFLM
jgi:hypothetical protein